MGLATVLRLHGLAVMIACIGGCFGPSYPVGLFCSELETCPPGQVCNSGICGPPVPGSDADGSPDASAAPGEDAAVPDPIDAAPQPIDAALPPTDDAALPPPADAAAPDAGRRPCEDDDECPKGQFCDYGQCRQRPEPTCEDRIQNGDETDEDCGGEVCDPCEDGLRCRRNRDCISQICDGKELVCLPTFPFCGDGDVNRKDEECDDGNPQSGDGCSATCQIETRFVGFIRWTQDATRQTDEEQDSAMNAACADEYPGSRAASMDELATGALVDLPETNPFDKGPKVMGVCPGCVGNANPVCRSGHERTCVPPRGSFRGPFDRNCFAAARATACVSRLVPGARPALPARLRAP